MNKNQKVIFWPQSQMSGWGTSTHWMNSGQHRRAPSIFGIADRTLFSMSTLVKCTKAAFFFFFFFQFVAWQCVTCMFHQLLYSNSLCIPESSYISPSVTQRQHLVPPNWAMNNLRGGVIISSKLQ